jgi:hypothetical protein
MPVYIMQHPPIAWLGPRRGFFPALLAPGLIAVAAAIYIVCITSVVVVVPAAPPKAVTVGASFGARPAR